MDNNTSNKNLSMSLKDYQTKVDQFIMQFEDEYWPPLSMFAALVEEIGEVARVLNKQEGHKPLKPDEFIKGLSEEIGDVLFSVICLANYYHIDLDQSISNTLEKYILRDQNRWKHKETDENS